MGLAKTPLVVGRTVDLMSEIKPVATKTLLDTYFKKGIIEVFIGSNNTKVMVSQTTSN